MRDIETKYFEGTLDAFFRKYSGIHEGKMNSRLRSWEHCRQAFSEAHLKRVNQGEIDKDFLALHLGFYLASWGMHRNSPLLECDYKVHMKTVDILFDQHYERLWNFNPIGKTPKEIAETADLLCSSSKKGGLFKRITSVYRDLFNENRGDPKKAVSITLVSKILLGTLCCVPALDRYVKRALQSLSSEGPFGFLKPKGVLFSNLCSLINNKQGALGVDPLRSNYLPMRMLDICLWRWGRLLDRNDWSKKADSKGNWTPERKNQDALQALKREGFYSEETFATVEDLISEKYPFLLPEMIEVAE